jgi:hypothetical protein
MPEQKKKIPLFGTELEVADVPVLDSKEPYYEYDLEDGSHLRVKHVATAILRIEGQFLPDGSPVYFIMSSPVISVVSSTLTSATATKDARQVK